VVFETTTPKFERGKSSSCLTLYRAATVIANHPYVPSDKLTVAQVVTTLYCPHYIMESEGSHLYSAEPGLVLILSQT
jgi:hypothetical protein